MRFWKLLLVTLVDKMAGEDGGKVVLAQQDDFFEER